MTTTCDAGTVGFQLSPSGYGMDRVPCRQSVGLRAFPDLQGETRHYCSAEGHKHQAERRYGLADPPEPDWQMPESPPIQVVGTHGPNERAYDLRHDRWGHLNAVGRFVPDDVPESADPVTAAKGWSEAEARLAWGDR